MPFGDSLFPASLFKSGLRGVGFVSLPRFHLDILFDQQAAMPRGDNHRINT